MNDLLSCARELQHLAHKLMYLGMDGEPIYSDDFTRLNKEVLVESDSLLPQKFRYRRRSQPLFSSSDGL